MNKTLLKSLFPKFTKSVEESFKIITRSKKMAQIKKQDNEFSHIDFKNGILYESLKQIRYNDLNNIDQDIPKLVDVWACRFKPLSAKSFVKFIRDFITPFEEQEFTHLKRLQKVVDGKSFTLKGILCSTKLYKTKESISNYIQEYGEEEMQNISIDDIMLLKIPSTHPATREICIKWSQEYWPMSWKGNPNHQFLKEVSFDMKKENINIQKLLRILQEGVNSDCKRVPVATMVIDSKSEEIITSSLDCRFEHPLHHSIMKAIEQVAEKERLQRKEAGTIDETSGYLLNGLTVYTTHEPCVMCSMGLVHSRIQRLIFLQPTKNGALETNYQLGDRDDLNWRFETWRWLRPDDLAQLHQIEKGFTKKIPSINI